DPGNPRTGVHAHRGRGELVGAGVDAASPQSHRDQRDRGTRARTPARATDRRAGGITMTATRAPAAKQRPRSRRGEGDTLRADLLAATERLMIETGSAEAVSIRAIADAVGVTPPSIYLHFPDKDSLILAVCERHFEAFDAVIEEAGRSTAGPVESL